MLTEERKETTTALCGQMIHARSYSGEEAEAAAVMRRFGEAHGFDEIVTDRLGNVMCYLKGRRPGPTVLFDGHIDTVPVPDPSAWTHDPYGAEIVDGRLYGRGTSDMKGAVTAMMAAAAFFAEDTKRDFAGTIVVSGVVHEECFEGVASREISKAVKPDCVVIGESTLLDVKIGQRGRAEIVVETFGKPAHSSNPEKGNNAVYQMTKVIDAIRGLEPPVHPILGKGILELTDIKSSPYPGKSVVPDYCKVTYDRRLLVGETKESVLKPIQELLDKLSEEMPELNAKVSYAYGEEKCYTGDTICGERFFPAWLYDESEDYIQDTLAELHAIGCEPEVRVYDFCTNGSHYAGEAGIRTLGIGPSRENLAHTIDEYIELDQLTKAVDCYYAVMKALMKERA